MDFPHGSVGNRLLSLHSVKLLASSVIDLSFGPGSIHFFIVWMIMVLLRVICVSLTLAVEHYNFVVKMTEPQVYVHVCVYMSEQEREGEKKIPLSPPPHTHTDHFLLFDVGLWEKDQYA